MISIKLSLPDGIDPKKIVAPDLVPVTFGFQQGAYLCMARVLNINGSWHAELDIETSLAVVKRPDDFKAVAIGFVRPPSPVLAALRPVDTSRVIEHEGSRYRPVTASELFDESLRPLFRYINHEWWVLTE